MLKFMTSLLEREGYKVLTAEDGLSALEILESYTPDVMFIDLTMPNIKGKKLCRIVRTMPKMKDAYLIIVSAIAAEQDVHVAEFGANACIAKGPLKKMSEHVLGVLNKLGKSDSKGLEEKLIGFENIRKRGMTKELLSTKRHLEAILSNTSQATLELTPEARIVYVNSIAASFFGLPEEKLLASNFTELFQETYRNRMKGLFESVGDSPRTIGENLPVMLNGKRISVNMLRVKEDERETIIAVLDDISERKRVEAQLREARKMEAIGALAGGIAHQFNNALAVFAGNTELLEINFHDDKKIGKYIEPMKNSIQRMSKLTSQLLAYAKGGKYQTRTISIKDFIRDTLPLIMHAVAPSIHVETHLPEDMLNVEADLAQLQMVLSAVLSNASESIEGEGHIRISAGNEELDGEFVKNHADLKIGPYVCLTIQDDGRGMDEEIRDKIFEPFFTTKFQGRGLGMAAVYGIVKNHEGSILVHSELCKGTEIRIYLPASESEIKNEKEPKSEVTSGVGTILVIEDEEMVMDVSTTMLRKLGHHVLEAKTGKEAVDIAENFGSDIDLALLDIQLPDMEGTKIYPLIKEARPNLKVIVCSGYTLEGPAQEIIDAGAQDFIQKPFSITTLSEKMKDVLESK